MCQKCYYFYAFINVVMDSDEPCAEGGVVAKAIYERLGLLSSEC